MGLTAIQLPPIPRSPTPGVCSKIARDSVAPELNELEQKVMNYIRARGGATADECSRGIGRRLNTISSVVAKLGKRGVLINSRTCRRTETGRPAIVWKEATP